MQILVKTKPSYLIKIEKGLILNKGFPEGFLVTDKNVYDKYKHLIKNKVFVIESSENSKSLENYIKILESLSDENTIIAFGGGVVGDLAGFVASTYKRGIKFIQVPTTLLAMVDSSIGGKNGVNLGEKKNYIGTIYQPAEVLIDPLFLQTLPEKEMKNGLAEVIKYSYLFGKPDLNKILLKMEVKDIDKMIFDCCKNKVDVVEKDTFDKGYRHVLNFGHTIGHGIELISGLAHGEAVSIGMVKEAELGLKLGIIQKNTLVGLKEALNQAGLPIELPQNVNIDDIIRIMAQDKKGKFIFALSKSQYSVKIEEKTIREILQN